MRLIVYKTKKERTISMENHCDLCLASFITELSDTEPCLQIYKNKWIDIELKKDYCIMIIGSFTQFITKGKFKALSHRVLSTNKIRSVIVLFSIPNNNINVPLSEIHNSTFKHLIPGILKDLNLIVNENEYQFVNVNYQTFYNNFLKYF